MTTQPRSDEDDATRIQSPFAREVNEQLGAAWANPGSYDQTTKPIRIGVGMNAHGMVGDRITPRPPLPPETSSTLSQYPYAPLPQAPRRAQPDELTTKPRKGWWLWVLAILAALIIGALAASSAEIGSPLGAPAPAPTVTVTAEPVIMTVTPDSCFAALNASDEAFEIAGKVFGAGADAMEAATRYDVADMEKATARLEKYRKKLAPVADDYRAERDYCNASR